MVESKVSLSLFVPGANMLSSQECEKNPKDSYDENKITVSYTKGKGKKAQKVKKTYVFMTRKQRLITQNININREAYEYMLQTPTTTKLSKPVKRNNAGDVIQRVWDTMSVDARLKEHFNLIAHDFRAVSYSYEILDD